jgi:hypothetical protein
LTISAPIPRLAPVIMMFIKRLFLANKSNKNLVVPF